MPNTQQDVFNDSLKKNKHSKPVFGPDEDTTNKKHIKTNSDP